MGRPLGPAMVIATMFAGAVPASAAKPQQVTGSETSVVFRGEGGGNFATGSARCRQHATGQGTLGVRANLDLVNTVDNGDGSNTSEITGTYSC